MRKLASPHRVSVTSAIVLITLLILPACSSEPAELPQPEPRSHAEFSLTPPAGFVQTRSPASTPATVPGPTVAAEFDLPGSVPGAARASLTVVLNPTSGDLTANIVGTRQMLQATFPDYRSTIDEPISLPSGRQGWLLGGAYTLKGAKVQTIQLEVVEHQIAYAVVGMTSEAVFDKFDPVFRSAFSTFTLQ